MNQVQVTYLITDKEATEVTLLKTRRGASLDQFHRCFNDSNSVFFFKLVRTLKVLSLVLIKLFLKTCSNTTKAISLSLHKFSDPVKRTLPDVFRSPLNDPDFILKNKKLFVKGSLCGIQREGFILLICCLF